MSVLLTGEASRPLRSGCPWSTDEPAERSFGGAGNSLGGIDWPVNDRSIYYLFIQ